MKKTLAAKQSGFTLIEIIVALSIFALLGAGSYQVVNGLSGVQQALEGKAKKIRQLDRVMRTIERDFQQVAARSVQDNNGIRQAAVYSEGDYPILFTRHGARNPLLSRRSELIRVAYGIEEDLTDEELEGFIDVNNSEDVPSSFLVRYTWKLIDQGYDAEPDKQVLLAGVSNLNIEYLEKAEEWDIYWPPNASTAEAEKEAMVLLPAAIKLQFESEYYGELERIVQLIDRPEDKDE